MTEKPRKSRRGRRPAPDSERKDRVIQTRVPQDLEHSLRDAAERERVTVSHLIRNVLEDSFRLVDGIVADSSQLVDNVARDARRLASAAKGQSRAPTAFVPADQGGTVARALLDAVDAWQEVIVNKPTQCTQCGVTLPRGQKALRGLTPEPAAPVVWLCNDCLNKDPAG
ncbi:MAG TPA: hypothetical protein VFX91_07435 [Alcanivorax sp.]|nr:hypothetical protein [Alcanivorax sp.]